MVATPALRVPEPSTVAPYTACTVPVGVPEAALIAATVTLRVTVPPRAAGFGDIEVTVVVVAVLLTV